jgi:nucleoside-diphosphate-sugar epimerase
MFCHSFLVLLGTAIPLLPINHYDINSMISKTSLFRRPRILIIGCGDIGIRVAQQLQGNTLAQSQGRPKIFALSKSPERFNELRKCGITPIEGNLDHPETLWRIAHLATTVVHLAPPPLDGELDQRTRNLVQILSQQGRSVRRLVYISTTGVYGNRNGDFVDETSQLQPTSARAKRRVDAEQTLRYWAASQGVVLTILRVPGIYGPNRLPIERLQNNTPALQESFDAYSNHIHADDLARLTCAALFIGKPQRVINACDGSEQKMGDYFDEVASALHLPKPPRLLPDEVRAQVGPMMWSFMAESRRVRNQRLGELKRPLKYPRVKDYLKTL